MPNRIEPATFTAVGTNKKCRAFASAYQALAELMNAIPTTFIEAQDLKQLLSRARNDQNQLLAFAQDMWNRSRTRADYDQESEDDLGQYKISNPFTAQDLLIRCVKGVEEILVEIMDEKIMIARGEEFRPLGDLGGEVYNLFRSVLQSSQLYGWSDRKEPYFNEMDQLVYKSSS